jgi:hypothetical protein
MVSAALAKEGVRARLDTPVSGSAVPGETIEIAWTLSYIEHGERRPFGATGVFVRLLSASGGDPAKAYGKEHGGGRYVAKAKVPAAGIAGIEIGLEGTRSMGEITEYADVLFPVDNARLAMATATSTRERPDPHAGPEERPSNVSAVWLVPTGGLAVLGAVVVARRRQQWRQLRDPTRGRCA